LEHRWISWLKRRWLLVVVSLALLALAAGRLGEIRNISLTLLHGDWQWVLVAVVLQILCFVLYAALYHSSFATVEVQSRWRDLVPVFFASVCLKTMVPSGGVSGVALFIDDAAKRGQSSARAAQGALLVLALDLATMTPILLYGLLYLSTRGALQAYQAVGVAAFLAFTAGLAAMLLLGLRHHQLLCGLLTTVQQLANQVAAWLRRPPLLPEDWAQKNAAEFAGAAAGMAAHPRRLGRALALALLIHLLDVVGLYAVFLAYGQPVGLGAVAVGFGLDVVFSVVTFIPHGLGVAEGAITLALTSLGIPAAKALVVALVARGLNIWLPFALGFAFLHKVRTFGARRPAEQPTARREAEPVATSEPAHNA